MLNLDSGVGIEINDGHLVLAAVKKGLRTYSLKNHLIVENYKELAPADLQSRMQRFLSSNGFNRENVVLGIPREEVIVRNLELPSDVEENLDNFLRLLDSE